MEVNESGDGLAMCEYPGEDGYSEADIMGDCTSVYFDSNKNIYYFIFYDYIQYGLQRHDENTRAIYLQEGKIAEKFLYSADTTYSEDGKISNYYDGDGNPVSKNEYDVLSEHIFENLEKRQATFQWEYYTWEELQSMKKQDLYDMLEKSYLGFSVN